MPQFIEYNLETGDAIKIEEPESHNGYYNKVGDKEYWGYFWHEKIPYFFHNESIYPIHYPGNVFKIEYISNIEAKFSFFKDGKLLEQTLYPRTHEDNWRDEEDKDVFDGPVTLHKVWKQKQADKEA